MHVHELGEAGNREGGREQLHTLPLLLQLLQLRCVLLLLRVHHAERGRLEGAQTTTEIATEAHGLRSIWLHGQLEQSFHGIHGSSKQPPAKTALSFFNLSAGSLYWKAASS